MPPAPVTEEEPAADDLAAARRRRLNPAPEDELALGEDAIEMVADEESATETTMEISDGSLGTERPAEAHLDDAPAADGAPDPSEEREHQHDDPAAHEPKAKPAKRRGRASVPSWDEIMFGGPSERG